MKTSSQNKVFFIDSGKQKMASRTRYFIEIFEIFDLPKQETELKKGFTRFTEFLSDEILDFDSRNKILTYDFMFDSPLFCTSLLVFEYVK